MYNEKNASVSTNADTEEEDSMKTLPIIHLVVLIIGGFVLFVLKRKYPKIRNYELVVIFILLALLAGIFTDTGIDLIKRLISFIQID